MHLKLQNNQKEDNNTLEYRPTKSPEGNMRKQPQNNGYNLSEDINGSENDEFTNDEGSNQEIDCINSDEILKTNAAIENHTEIPVPISEEEQDEKISFETQSNQSESTEERAAKQFKCNYCSEQFAKNHILVAHERIHTGEKPFQCNFCEKSFCQRASRISHERLHTGEKPF